jgi:hypothetical protein
LAKGYNILNITKGRKYAIHLFDWEIKEEILSGCQGKTKTPCLTVSRRKDRTSNIGYSYKLLMGQEEVVAVGLH